MSIKIPFMPTSESAAPLKRIIQDAARHMNMTDYVSAIFASYIFEGVVREVSKGNAVPIPGFGLFAPVTVVPKYTDKQVHASPRFSASRAFRQEVEAVCTAYPVGALKFANHIKCHRVSSRPDLSGARTMTAMAAFRDRVSAEARRCGIDL